MRGMFIFDDVIMKYGNIVVIRNLVIQCLFGFMSTDLLWMKWNKKKLVPTWVDGTSSVFELSIDEKFPGKL